MREREREVRKEERKKKGRIWKHRKQAEWIPPLLPLPPPLPSPFLKKRVKNKDEEREASLRRAQFSPAGHFITSFPPTK